MGTKIKIMDLEMDLLTEETFYNEMKTYLSNDYLNIVHMISLDYVDTYDENELVRETLEEADLVLPGEKAILSSYHVDVLETGGMIVDYRMAKNIFNKKLLDEKTCYLVLKNKKEAKIICRYVTSHFPSINLVGLYTADGSVTEEALINDINTKIPDLILMSLESTQGEAWIHNNKSKINSKLCIVMSSIMDMVIRENIHVPKFIKSIHLGSLYTQIARIPYSSSRRKRIFQKKMDNYNNKKLLEEAEVEEELSDEEKNPSKQ